MNRRTGFTLLEICLAVAIIVLLVMIAVPSVKGVLDEQRLHRTFDAFDQLVRQAQARSVRERRTFALAWTRDGVDLVAIEKRESDATAEPLRVGTEKDEGYSLARPAALSKEAPPVWTFWRSGVCEPAVVSYHGPAGSWVVKYDALTAHGTFLREDVK